MVETRDGRREYWLNRPCPSVICKAGPLAGERLEREKLRTLFGAADIPPLYRLATLDDFPRELALPVETARRDGQGLLLTGPVGTGKSRMAAALLAACLAEGKAGLFVSLPRLLTLIRDTYGRPRDYDGPTERKLVDTAAGMAWLVLDDLGVQTGSRWERQEVWQLVDERYTRQRPLVCTTNLPLGVLARDDFLGERTVSRLREMCQVVTFTGQDRRLLPPDRRGW